MDIDQAREKQKLAAAALLKAAHEFWSASLAAGQEGAVQWVTDANGALLVFTRGEYRERIMANILKLGAGSGEYRFEPGGREETNGR